MPKSAGKKRAKSEKTDISTFPPEHDPISSIFIPPPEALGVKVTNKTKIKGR